MIPISISSLLRMAIGDMVFFRSINIQCSYPLILMRVAVPDVRAELKFCLSYAVVSSGNLFHAISSIGREILFDVISREMVAT